MSEYRTGGQQKEGRSQLNRSGEYAGQPRRRTDRGSSRRDRRRLDSNANRQREDNAKRSHCHNGNQVRYTPQTERA